MLKKTFLIILISLIVIALLNILIKKNNETTNIKTDIVNTDKGWTCH